MVLLAASAVAVVATGGLAARLGRLLGLGSTVVRVWDIAKWPVLLLIVGFSVRAAVLGLPQRQAAISLDHPGRDPGRGGLGRCLGGLRAVCGQLRLLQQDLRQPGRRDHLSGVAVAVNTAILLGAELNAELERSRAIAAGHPPDEEPYMELRDTTKLRERDNL